jgi:SAM-dependent methyltransferase
MKNEQQWQPTRYIQSEHLWRASRQTAEVAVSSRLCVDLVGEHYSSAIPRFARGDFLDLGCGKAPLYGLYRQYQDTVTCVDWSQSFHGCSYIDVEADLNQPLPLANGAFDTILCSDVIEHLAEPTLFFSETARILRSGGHLLLNTPFTYPLHEAPHDYFRYTSFALRRFCEQHRLEVVSLHPLGGYPEVVADLLAKRICRLPLIGGFLASAIQSLVFWRRSGARPKLSETYSRPLMYALIARKKL